MKTLILSAIVATAALTGAASAQVGSGAAAAIAHFNGDYDSRGDIRSVPAGGFNGVFVSTRSGNLSRVYSQFNADYDSRSDLRGLNGATLVNGPTGASADIFARIRAESRENE